ncbi:MAG: histidine kinase dimerization/phosphoacceptor domain -containing protein [Crocinitomicaceae bacterium]
MPTEYSYNLFEELDSISKIHTLKRDGIDDIMDEFSKRIVRALKIERLSAWLFDAEKSAMFSIGEFDIRTSEFRKNSVLPYSDYKKYIENLFSNKIITSKNVLEDERLSELKNSYSIPNDVISLMDIPMRMEGEIIGVLCFEKTGLKERDFSNEDQFFALSISSVLSSTLEARKRRVIQHQLDKELAQKELFLREIKHRIKNNLSVVSSLLRLQSERSLDDYHRELFLDCNNRIESISTIYDLISKTEKIQIINFNHYISTLINKIQDTFKSQFECVEVDYSIPNIDLKVDLAVNLALIINEVITNSYKHAFENRSDGKIVIKITLKEEIMTIVITDDGKGFVKMQISDSLGMGIIDGLIEQINGDYSYSGENGSQFNLSFNINC